MSFSPRFSSPYGSRNAAINDSAKNIYTATGTIRSRPALSAGIHTPSHAEMRRNR